MAVINQALVGGCYLWGLWLAPPLSSPVFTFGIEVSLRQIGRARRGVEGWGGGPEKQKHFELKAPQAACLHQVNKPDWPRSLFA